MARTLLGDGMTRRAIGPCRVWAVTIAVVAAVLPASPAANAVPTHSYRVWRIERVDGRPHRLKVTVPVGGAKPGAFFGDISVKHVGGRDVPVRVHDDPAAYGYMFEGGHQDLVPTADIDEGPVHATSPTCTDLNLGTCATPTVPGLASTMTPGEFGWIADTPIAFDFYAVIYDVQIKGSPLFDKTRPGWRAKPVSNVSVIAVTKQDAEATGVSDGDDTVEHFHQATVSSGAGYSVVQAILPCLGTTGPGARNGPGVGSAQLRNTLGLSVTLDCDHPIYVAAASRRTDWTLSGDVIGHHQAVFPYSRLIETNFPA